MLDLIPASVEKVSVGKRSGRHSKVQTCINDLIVAAALAGRRVVRLKGGDPSIFGRSTEEMDACTAYGITVQICPGITTASAAAASAGISLTQRGLARKLTFVTAHARAGDALDLDWDALADPQATLAIYMGRSVARELSSKLQAAGLPAATPVLVVENASLTNERLVQTRLDLLELAIPLKAGGPTIILVGQGVAVHRKAATRMDAPCADINMAEESAL